MVKQINITGEMNWQLKVVEVGELENKNLVLEKQAKKVLCIYKYYFVGGF